MFSVLFVSVLWGLFLWAWIVEKSRTGYRFGPMAILLGMFAVIPTLFLAPGIHILKVTPELLGHGVYLMGLLSIILGYVCYAAPRVRLKSPFPVKIYQVIIIVCIVFAVVSLAQGFYQLVKFGFFSSDVSGVDAYAARTQASEDSGGTWSFAFSTLTGSFRQISGFSIIILLTTFRARFPFSLRFVGWFVAVAWVLIQFASLSRGALIWPILIFLILVYNFSRRIPWGKVFKGLSVALVIMVVLTLFRDTEDEFYGRSYSHPGVEVDLPFWKPNMFTWITETLIYYQGHPFGNFGAIMNNRFDFKPSYGHEALRGSSFLLRLFAPREWYYAMAENAQLNTKGRMMHGTYRQWSTWFGSLYQSFGMVGIPIVMFGTGFFFAAVQRFAQAEGGGIEKMYFAALSMIAVSVPAPYFMGTVGGFGLFFFCLFVYTYIMLKRRSFGSR